MFRRIVAAALCLALIAGNSGLPSHQAAAQLVGSAPGAAPARLGLPVQPAAPESADAGSTGQLLAPPETFLGPETAGLPAAPVAPAAAALETSRPVPAASGESLQTLRIAHVEDPPQTSKAGEAREPAPAAPDAREYLSEQVPAVEDALHADPSGLKAEASLRDLYQGPRANHDFSLPAEAAGASEPRGDDEARLQGTAPEKPARLSEPAAPLTAAGQAVAAPTLALLLRWGGIALVALAAAPLLGALLPAHPLFFFGGALALGAATFLRRPTGPSAPGESKAVSAPGWLARAAPSFLELAQKARGSMEAHRFFQDRVGAASPRAFWAWLKSGLRTAIYWLPGALVAMLAGALATIPLRTIDLNPAVAGTSAGNILLNAPWASVLLQQLAIFGAEQMMFLGVFAGLRRLLLRAGAPARGAAWLAGLGTLSLYLPYLLLLAGQPLAGAVPLLALEAVILLSYVRSRTLLVPMAIQTLISAFSLYSARFVGLLQSAPLGPIVGTGPWGLPLALLAGGGIYLLSAALRHGRAHGWRFLGAAIREDLAQLKGIGDWWKTDLPDREPKPFWKLLPAAFFWAIPLFLVNTLTYKLTTVVFPQQETLPEIMTKIVVMPLDLLVYNFAFAAALEEWVFRKGIFSKLRGGLEKKGVSPRWSFWRAAVLSAVIFSLVHMIPLPLPGVGEAFAAYSPSVAGAMARIAAGIFLAFLYARSRILILPILAHFASNMLEVIGLQAGLWAYLAAFAGGVALHSFLKSGTKDPAEPRPNTTRF